MLEHHIQVCESANSFISDWPPRKGTTFSEISVDIGGGQNFASKGGLHTHRKTHTVEASSARGKPLKATPIMSLLKLTKDSNMESSPLMGKRVCLLLSMAPFFKPQGHFSLVCERRAIHCSEKGPI